MNFRAFQGDLVTIETVLLVGDARIRQVALENHVVRRDPMGELGVEINSTTSSGE
jgi:hypothetical protein